MSFASRARYWLPLLPLLGLLAGTYWLNRLAQSDMEIPVTNTSHEPDAIIENFSAVQLDQQGMPRFIMTAKKMQHFPDTNITEIETPRATILSPDRPAIHSVAERGTISGKGDVIFLHGNVEVLRSANTERSELRAHTEFLQVVPDKNLISSDKAVSITEAGKTLHATGLEMDNNSRTIKLLSKVSARYVSE